MNRPFHFFGVLAGLALIAAGQDWALRNADAQQAMAPAHTYYALIGTTLDLCVYTVRNECEEKQACN